MATQVLVSICLSVQLAPFIANLCLVVRVGEQGGLFGKFQPWERRGAGESRRENHPQERMGGEMWRRGE